MRAFGNLRVEAEGWYECDLFARMVRQKNEEEQYIRMIRETVESNSFYFSFGYHLYRRVSAQSQGASDRDASPFVRFC